MPSLDRASSRKSPPREPIQPVVTIGLAVLAGATELVVIRGDVVRGTVIDRAVTETRTHATANGSRLQQTIDNVLQTRALAIAHGYHVHAVGVTCDGANAMITDRLIVALKSAGLENVSALDPDVAREIFTQLEIAARDDAGAIRARGRRRWLFAAAMVIAVAALTFAIVDRWQATPRPTPQSPAVTPTAPSTTMPPPPVIEAPPPPPLAPPITPTQEPPTPEHTPPPRRAPAQRAPTHRPAPPSAPPPVEAPPEPDPAPAPADNCMFLCGVSL